MIAKYQYDCVRSPDEKRLRQNCHEVLVHSGEQPHERLHKNLNQSAAMNCVGSTCGVASSKTIFDRVYVFE